MSTKTVGAGEIALQHAHVEGQLVAFQMRNLQLDNGKLSMSAVALK